MVSSSPPVPALPANASTATQTLFTISAILAVIATVTWPTQVAVPIGQYAAIGSGLALAFGAIVHAYWDHSP